MAKSKNPKTFKQPRQKGGKFAPKAPKEAGAELETGGTSPADTSQVAGTEPKTDETVSSELLKSKVEAEKLQALVADLNKAGLLQDPRVGPLILRLDDLMKKIMGIVGLIKYYREDWKPTVNKLLYGKEDTNKPAELEQPKPTPPEKVR